MAPNAVVWVDVDGDVGVVYMLTLGMIMPDVLLDVLPEVVPDDAADVVPLVVAELVNAVVATYGAGH